MWQVAAFQRAPFLPVEAREEGAVRVQCAQHAIDRRTHQLGVRHRIHIVRADVVQDACLRALRFIGGFRGADGRVRLLAIGATPATRA